MAVSNSADNVVVAETKIANKAITGTKQSTKKATSNVASNGAKQKPPRLDTFVAEDGTVTYRPASERIAENSIEAATKGVTSLEKASGSYLLEFQSGKFYAGKGLESRMMQSVNRIETTFGDKLLNKTFYPAANSKAAFINEYNLMKNIGLPTKYDPNSLLYNKIWSPGKKLLGE